VFIYSRCEFPSRIGCPGDDELVAKSRFGNKRIYIRFHFAEGIEVADEDCAQKNRWTLPIVVRFIDRAKESAPALVARLQSFREILSYAYVGRVDRPSKQTTEYRLSASGRTEERPLAAGGSHEINVFSLEGLLSCVCVCVCVCVHSGIPSDQSSGTSSPLCDSGLHLNYHPNTVMFSPVSSLCDGPIL